MDLITFSGGVFLMATFVAAVEIHAKWYGLTTMTAILLVAALAFLTPALFYGFRSEVLRSPKYSIERVMLIMGGGGSVLIAYILYWINGGQDWAYFNGCLYQAIALTFWFMFLADRSGFFAFMCQTEEDEREDGGGTANEDRDNVKLETIYYYDEREQ